MTPEEAVINPSSLTKFRKLRLKDTNLLDMLISKTVEIAIEKEIIKSKSIIVDATHTKSRYNSKTPQQALQEHSKALRRAVYETDESMKEQFPEKNTETSLEKEIEYCKQLMDVIKQNDIVSHYPKVAEKLNLLEETIADDLEHLKTSIDEEAKTGHKTADTSFFWIQNTPGNDRRTHYYSSNHNKWRKTRRKRTDFVSPKKQRCRNGCKNSNWR